MNPLIKPASSLIVPLSQLSPYCNKLLNSLKDGRSTSKQKVLYEQTLWNEVKKIRTLNNSSIYLYLVGYYHTILYQIPKVSAKEDLFQYHILIRLGDLNRYLERTDVAEYYYCNARNLFPQFGHAYNQLGLLTKPNNCYKCCYYYARAARSSEKPLNTIADSNLKIAISKYNCEILRRILKLDEVCIANCDESLEGGVLPETPFEWFYAFVVAIYADNIQPIAKMFLQYLNENFSTQRTAITRNGIKIITIYCDRESYILLTSLDILLDWLKYGSQGKSLCPTINVELRQIQSSLNKILNLCRSNSRFLSGDGEMMYNNSDHSSIKSETSHLSLEKTTLNLFSLNSTAQDLSVSSRADSSKSASCMKLAALPHDYVLRGFKPLDIVHKELFFKIRTPTRGSVEESSIECDRSASQNFIDTEQLVQIVTRLRTKLEGFGPFIRKQTRNIALESILSNMDKNNGL